MQLTAHASLRTIQHSNIKSLSCQSADRASSQSIPSSITFGAEKTDKKFMGVLGGAILGLLTTLGGVGTYFYSWTAVDKPQPAVVSKTDFPIEKALVDESKLYSKKETRGLLFDSVSGAVKKGLWRFATGEKASEAFNGKQSQHIVQNAMREGEDHVCRVNRLIAELSGDKNTVAVVNRSIGRSQASQGEYYKALDTVLSLANKDPKAQGYTSRLVWGSYDSQMKAATETLSKNDRAAFADLLTKLSQADSSHDLNQYRAVYTEFVEKIVAKYEPEQAKTCLAAGQQLFDSMQKIRDGEALQNQQNQADFETKQSAYDQQKAVLSSYAGKLTGFGLLGFLLFGAGAYTMASRKDN